MVVLVLALATLLVGGLAQSPSYQRNYQANYHPASQVYQPGTDRARYLPLTSQYQAFDPQYQTFGFQYPAVSQYQQVDPLYQAVGSQYQALQNQYQSSVNQYQTAASVYQAIQSQYQPTEPQYQPAEIQYQPTQLHFQPAEPQYQPGQYQPSTVQPQYQADVPVYQPGTPQYQPSTVESQYKPIESQYQTVDEFGQYSFGFSGEDSAREESRAADGSVRGSFSYVDETGRTQTQHYVADALGFRVTGTNLPKAPQDSGHGASVPHPQVVALPTPAPVQDTPEVAAAKAAFIKAYNAAAIAAAEAPDVD